MIRGEVARSRGLIRHRQDLKVFPIPESAGHRKGSKQNQVPDLRCLGRLKGCRDASFYFGELGFIKGGAGKRVNKPVLRIKDQLDGIVFLLAGEQQCLRIFEITAPTAKSPANDVLQFARITYIHAKVV
jgi:hypothetical protein